MSWRLITVLLIALCYGLVETRWFMGEGAQNRTGHTGSFPTLISYFALCVCKQRLWLKPHLFWQYTTYTCSTYTHRLFWHNLTSPIQQYMEKIITIIQMGLIMSDEYQKQDRGPSPHEVDNSVILNLPLSCNKCQTEKNCTCAATQAGR